MATDSDTEHAMRTLRQRINPAGRMHLCLSQSAIGRQQDCARFKTSQASWLSDNRVEIPDSISVLPFDRIELYRCMVLRLMSVWRATRCHVHWRDVLDVALLPSFSRSRRVAREPHFILSYSMIPIHPRHLPRAFFLPEPRLLAISYRGLTVLLDLILQFSRNSSDFDRALHPVAGFHTQMTTDSVTLLGWEIAVWAAMCLDVLQGRGF